MHGSKTAIFLSIIISLSFSPVLQAAEVPEIDLTSARTAAMGGAHAALADDLTTLFNNPAGFRSAGPEFLVAGISLGLSGPIFDILSIVAGGGSNEDLFTSPNIQSLLQGLYAAFNMVGPISLGYVGNGLGFGFFNTSNVSFATRGTVPTITAKISENVLIAGGYAFRIPLPEKSRSSLDIGILCKALISGQSTIEKDLLALFDAFSNPTGLIFNEPFQLSLGAGIDLGVLYNYNDRFSVGLVGRDLFMPCLMHNYSTLQGFLGSEEPASSSALQPIDLSIGFLYKPPLGRLQRVISDLKLMLDYQDILDFLTHPLTSKNPVLHVGLGVELILLEIISIRTGFYQGLINAGLGFDLSIFSLNLAMFGTELSPEPGMRPVFNILLGIEFKI